MEPMTLEDSPSSAASRERVRQIEMRAFDKVRHAANVVYTARAAAGASR
jgi:DNA-directed RNA polymerase sigma subunit (sigma70/sigma32)